MTGNLIHKEINIGIVVISDRASEGIYKDVSGNEIIRTLNDFINGKWNAVYRLIPDEQNMIEETLVELADNKKCCLIFTTGGTGPAKRDVTPEATEKICHKMMPGFGELMRNESLKYVPTAILSRQTAGIRNESLIINLPGKPSAIRQCMNVVFPAVPYCVELIDGSVLECNEEVIKIFRPG